MSGNEVTLEQLLALMDRAINGDRQLLVRLFRELQKLARNQFAPIEEQALAEVLGRVLIGERAPDLSGLSPEAAQEVEMWLWRLNDNET